MGKRMVSRLAHLSVQVDPYGKAASPAACGFARRREAGDGRVARRAREAAIPNVPRGAITLNRRPGSKDARPPQREPPGRMILPLNARPPGLLD